MNMKIMVLLFYVTENAFTFYGNGKQQEILIITCLLLWHWSVSMSICVDAQQMQEEDILILKQTCF